MEWIESERVAERKSEYGSRTGKSHRQARYHQLTPTNCLTAREVGRTPDFWCSLGQSRHLWAKDFPL